MQICTVDKQEAYKINKDVSLYFEWQVSYEDLPPMVEISIISNKELNDCCDIQKAKPLPSWPDKIIYVAPDDFEGWVDLEEVDDFLSDFYDVKTKKMIVPEKKWDDYKKKKLKEYEERKKRLEGDSNV